MADPVLCYVKDQWAWFTTQPLSDQWGDDWNDAPYEHNAGDPYGPVWHNLPEYVEKRGELCRCCACVRDWNDDGTPKWRVYKIAWDGSFEEPCAPHWNSPYSVQEINRGAAPWLASAAGRLDGGRGGFAAGHGAGHDSALPSTCADSGIPGTRVCTSFGNWPKLP